MSTSATKPQGSGDHAQAVAEHYNQLQETGLAQRTRSRIFYLRNFNNWVKSVLIADTLDKIREQDRHKHISVLDLASGKGGDLLKWKKGRISSLVCADIAATSVQQSEERYRQNSQREKYKLFDAEFIVADCTKERLKDKYKSTRQSFDLVSCQFSFHYCFESYQQAMMMIRNASECLRPGGYFIGTTPNSYELVRRLRNSPNSTFGNEVYSISFAQQEKSNFPLFGAKYNFHLEGVVDCPEFLVYFPALEKMAAQFGMKLVKRIPFADFFEAHCQSRENLKLLENMQALEPYPPMEGTELVSSKAEDYSSVKKFYNSVVESQSSDHSRSSKKIGTLSQDEWEAATLYLVFVFQKVKDVTPPMTDVTSSSAGLASDSTMPVAPSGAAPSS
ncbi:mRNA cap guanine-N7 methyltransferase [Aplysia californica]|uniref:mRNA cap guanine-N(7) methyltransferase n=1 Tax=Aplysia californica TaxID=6500 RepID=A0ABM0K3A6_APLCA|nr:mRNA cap guanine-N7 methyltransferase [Aplysia californica]